MESVNGLIPTLEDVWQFLASKFGGFVASVGDYIYLGEVLGACLVVVLLCGLAKAFVPFDWAKGFFAWLASLAVSAGAMAFFVWRHFMKRKRDD